jgi:cyclophilin family peptidyl-prolyl cis-trans isomerase/HEAT repeat protein
MRKLAIVSLFLFSCSSLRNQPAPASPPLPETHGLTLQEEARILQMEDRREYDGATIATFVTNANSLHRQRIALALGRIGPHVFVDGNANGQRDPQELSAGVTELNTLAGDPDRTVRETVAFSLGEIADPASADTLMKLASDSDASVAAEAIEAISKLPVGTVAADRLASLTAEPAPEGVRARAIRFLFRQNTDAANELAASFLGSTSTLLRREAAYSLSRRAYPAARARLELLLTDPDVPTRSYAVSALGRIAAPESFKVLFPLLGDIHPWVRTNTAVALSRIAAKDATQLTTADVPRIQALTEDPDPGTRANSIELLGFYAVSNETAFTRLRSLATNGSRWERELAISALARQFAETKPELISGELTEWQKVRVLEATTAMKRGVAIREEMAGDANAMVRANAIGNIPDETAATELPIIRAAMNDDDIIVRANAIDKLAKAGLPVDEQLAAFRAADEHERGESMNDARMSAIRAVAAIEWPEREAYLRNLLTDNDPMIRRLAADSIVDVLKLPRPQYTPLPSDRTLDWYATVAAWAQQPHTATIHLTRGTIDLQLLTADAPLTAWNFTELAKKKYFDGTTFMRVVPNFVVQSGDPRNDQNGGPGYSIRDEINLQKYTRGAVGMALSGPDTGGSQYFITHSPQPHLDGGYTIFARVLDGMTAVVDQTERGDLVQTITIDERKPATTGSGSN